MLFLVFTAWRQAFPKAHENDVQRRTASCASPRRFIDISDHYDGAKLRTVVDGKKIFTPMILVFVAIGFTDLIFAIDSIPAIFGITQSPFIVFTANIFALMGLRQLYFLLGGLLDRLKYLHYGIAFILAFIGVKLFFHALHTNELPFINDGEPVAVGTGDLDLDVAARHRRSRWRSRRSRACLVIRRRSSDEAAHAACGSRRRQPPSRRQGLTRAGDPHPVVL